MTKEDFANAMR